MQIEIGRLLCSVIPKHESDAQSSDESAASSVHAPWYCRLPSDYMFNGAVFSIEDVDVYAVRIDFTHYTDEFYTQLVECTSK